MVYLIMLILGYIFLYLVFPHLFSIFSDKKYSSTPTIKSIIIIALLMIATYFLTGAIEDRFWSNRLLHALGGGINVIVIIYLVLKDYKIELKTPKIIILSLLLATSLGVVNELFEFLLQSTIGWKFAVSVEDTWWDLLANFVGCLVGILLVPKYMSINDTK